jgi:LysM repeat protein
MSAVVPVLASLVLAAALQGSGGAYTVRDGDTLTAIASRTGVPAAELAQANGITDPNRIQAGQALTVPQPAPAAATAGATATAPAPESGPYTVRTGDTLSTIAARLGVSATELARANGVTDPNHIEVGQILQMPGYATTRDISAYRQLGTWADVYDYAPAFAGSSGVPYLAPTSVDAMAAAGIRTLYIQASINSSRATGLVEAPDILGAFLTRAHARGLRVVAWYLPTFSDIDADLQRLRAIREFRASGQGFDGLAVDIEATDGVTDPVRRNAALIDLSQRLRAETGTAIGAIVLPPVLLEVVNSKYWPSFPWQSLAPYYDVWLPMAYWTDRTIASGYRDPARYTAENIARLHADLAQPNAAVHMIGGIGGSSSADQYRAFVAAARKGGAVGVSVYDFSVTASSVWSILARK